MKTSLALVLAIAAFPALAARAATERAETRQAAQKHYSIQVADGGWGGANLDDLNAVYHSAINEIAVHLDAADLAFEPIRIQHGNRNPVVNYSRSVRGEIIVELNAKGNRWSQHAYQAAHEFCHILCRYKKADRSNLWFEESLCELASIYALRQMAITWKTDPPYPNWKDYSKSLESYVSDVENNHNSIGSEDFLTWFNQFEPELRSNPTRREDNGRIALELLPLFESYPAGWQSLPHLNTGPGEKEQTFYLYMKNWHTNTPGRHQKFVAKIGEKFGLSL